MKILVMKRYCFQFQLNDQFSDPSVRPLIPLLMVKFSFALG